MLPPRQRQRAICGDSWEQSGALTDIDGNPLAISGAAITWKLDDVIGRSNLIMLTSACGGGIAIADIDTAAILVTAPPSQTAAIGASTYRDWLRVTLADGAVLTCWSGLIGAAAAPA